MKLWRLAKGIGGISQSYGASLAEAAAFCLELHEHVSGTRLTVQEIQLTKAIVGDALASEKVTIEWAELEPAALGTWRDTQFATEQAAYGIAILLVVDLAGWSAVERSRKGTGFDFWLSSDQQPFAAKLEVSGILGGDRKQAKRRSREKLLQIQKSNTSIPGYVVIVEFSEPYSLLVKR